jgi:energy-coupling factor transport system permease protein
MMTSYALQSLSGQSVVARLDMRVKFALLLMASTLIFVWNSIALQAVFLLAMVALLLTAGVKIRTLRRLVAILVPALILITLIQGLWSPFGVTPVFTVPQGSPVLGGAHIFYVEGLLFGLVVCCRVLIPMLAFQLVFMTSEPREIVLGLVRIGIPYRVAFLFSTTFRFVPLLLSELEGLKEAQRLRGVDIDGIGVLRKMSVLARLLVPLIMSCLAKAQHLEIALQAKAFTGSKERTYLNPSRETLTAAERALILLLLALPVVALVGRILFNVGGGVS